MKKGENHVVNGNLYVFIIVNISYNIFALLINPKTHIHFSVASEFKKGKKISL